MNKKITILIAFLPIVLSACVTTQQLYVKDNGTQQAFNKDLYECSWGNADDRNKPDFFQTVRNCMKSKGYVEKDVSKEQYDASFKSLSEYSKQRRIKEGKEKP